MITKLISETSKSLHENIVRNMKRDLLVRNKIVHDSELFHVVQNLPPYDPLIIKYKNIVENFAWKSINWNSIGKIIGKGPFNCQKVFSEIGKVSWNVSSVQSKDTFQSPFFEIQYSNHNIKKNSSKFSIEEDESILKTWLNNKNWELNTNARLRYRLYSLMSHYLNFLVSGKSDTRTIHLFQQLGITVNTIQNNIVSHEFLNQYPQYEKFFQAK